MTQAGDMLVPASMKNKKIQFIDARDLAEWVIASIENKRTGIYNTVSDSNFSTLIATLAAVTKSFPKPIYVPDEFILNEGIQEWIDIPFWIAENDSATRYFMDVSNDKARKAGLESRPLERTCKDIYDWDQSRPQEMPMKAGLKPDIEASFLRKLQRSKL
jgi:2'-hydroxyisoflavone reductase